MNTGLQAGGRGLNADQLAVEFGSFVEPDPSEVIQNFD